MEMIQSRPDISVVVSVFGNVDQLPITVQSIQAQVGTDFEIVLVDDGNAPDDQLRLRELASSMPNVRLIVNPSNIGLTQSLRKGIDNARGRFIARIDNLDLMVPKTRLRTQLNAFYENEQLGVVGGAIEYVDLTCGDHYRSSPVEHHYPIADRSGQVSSLFSHVTVMFRADVYHRAGGYPENASVGQENPLWPKMLSMSEGRLLPEVFAIATMNDHSISVKKNRQQIIGKIHRLIKSPRARGGGASAYADAMFKTVLEIGKLAIPNRLRMRLNYRKNMLYLGRLPADAIRSIQDLATHLESVELQDHSAGESHHSLKSTAAMDPPNW